MRKLSILFTFLIISFVFFGPSYAQDLVISSNTTWEPGTYTYDNVTITNSAVLTFNGAVTLNAQNLTVDSGASLSSEGKGYPSSQGPGAGVDIDWAPGASYGGLGGKGLTATATVTEPYGSAIAPVDLGSGGGRSTWVGAVGGAGGGAIKVIISDTLNLEGKITANGADGPPLAISGGDTTSGGGGSGGSVYIIASKLTGSGIISANGGKADWRSGGGGGGRIAVYYQTSTFAGDTQTKGGIGNESGKDGTVVFIDQQNNILYTGYSFRFQENDSPFNFSKVILSNSKVTSQGAISLTTDELIIKDNSNLTLGGSTSTVRVNNLNLTSSSLTLNDTLAIAISNTLSLNTNSSLTSNAVSSLAVPSITVNNGSVLALSGKESLSVNGITLTNNSTLTHIPEGKLNLNLSNLTIDQTSFVSTNAKGYPSQQGPGAGIVDTHNRGSGAGYGGKGGDITPGTGGSAYGSAASPVDLGSGGGSSFGSLGGSGGGAAKIMVSDTLNLEGKITANGADGSPVIVEGEVLSGAGGSGGSVYIITSKLAGSGIISANGGKADWRSGGGGGGGRIAVYYKTSNFTGKAEVKGGIGFGNGEDGTIVFQPISLDTPLTTFNLIEKSSTTATSQETLSTQELTLNNVQITGDLTGTLNFTSLKLTTLTSGAFSGKGFLEGEFQTTLEGVSYQGNLQGVVYPDSKENKLHLKASISGLLISGIAEGYLTESVLGSGTYDKYQATWKLNRLGTDTLSATLSLEGAVSSSSSHAFTSPVYIYQASFEGDAIGSYSGPLSAVLTHLRLTGENDYKGKGFSIISYNSLLGQGEGYSYNQVLSEGLVDFQGLLQSPLLGVLQATLDETKSPKTLSGTIERLDLGETPAPNLKVNVWGPTRVSPGQTITYIIEYRNDGVVSAPEVAVVMSLSPFVEYVSASSDALVAEGINEVGWNLGDLPAKSAGYLSVQATVIWGLPQNIALSNSAYIESFAWHSQIIGTLRNGVKLPKKEYQVTMCTGTPETPGLCEKKFMSAEELQQFRCPEFRTCSSPKQLPQYESWRSVGSKYNSSWQPILNTGDLFPVADALHAAFASPVFGDGEGNPIATDYNGLNQTSETKDYDIAYSGGGPAGDGALNLGRETISTTNAEVKFTKYRVSPVLFGPDILLPLYKEKGVKKVVLYQSEYDDLLEFNGTISYSKQDGWKVKVEEGGIANFLPGLTAKIIGASDAIKLYEQKTGKQVEQFNVTMSKGAEGKYGKDKVSIKLAGKEEPIERYLQGNPKTGELFKQSDFANVEGIEVELRDRSKYKVPHTGWQTWILNVENIFTQEIDEKAATDFLREAINNIAQAHDPNELLVSPEGDVRPGDWLNYTINYENEGEGIAFGVYIRDTLEEDLDDSTLTINGGGTYDPNTRTITWFIGELASKQQGLVSFSINVNQNAPDKAEVINFATVYFPSVPETTRTNGTVNRVTTATDTIPPTTTATVNPTPNQSGWNNSDVTITLTVQDNEGGSGVSKTEYSLDNTNWTTYTTPFTVTTEGTTTVYYKSADNSGNTESPKSLETRLDKTPPVITSQASPQPNSSGWNNSDVTVTFAATDALSGVASVTQPQTITTEGANQIIGGQATDLADNSASTSVTLSIDKTQPEVIITTPQEQAEYLLNQNILTDWSATDALSGIASTTATVSSGSAIDTALVGSKTFSVSAKDKADNQKTLSLTYKVIYSFSGILAPIKSDGSSVFKLGSTIPVKFYLKDAQGNFVTNAVAKLTIQKFSDNEPIGEPIEATSTASSTTGNLFRYDTTDNQYIFNLSTKTLSTGLWQLKIELDDTKKYTIFVGLK